MNVTIIDNFDSFTFNLVEYFKLLNCKVTIFRNTIEPEIIDEHSPDLVVLSPGPSIPKKAGNLMRIVDHCVHKYPIFGVCLGHEALIEHFGGSLTLVKPMHGQASEMAHDGKTIFEGIPANFMGGRYHSLAGDQIPSCFEVSATSEGIVMAIRHKELPIEAVQFHPESVLTMKHGNGLKIIKNLLSTIA